jgi:predicted phage tail protein
MWHRRDWTVETLLVYWKDRHVDLQLQMEQRFAAQKDALEGSIKAQQDAINAALETVRQANEKTERAVALRFQSVNEFRQTLSDQASLFITRTEAEAAISRNAERIQDITLAMHELADKKDLITAYERVDARLLSVEKSITNREGRGSGLAAGWGYIATAVAIIASVITTYFVLQHGGTLPH